MDWRDIPVLIINRNRYASLQRLIAWLLTAGTRRMIIMDNASSYEPLLEYYRSLPPNVVVSRFGQNFGPHALWRHNVHKTITTPYIVTDADLVPAEFCPSDVIPAMLDVHCRYPDAAKVGPSLRIDNLNERCSNREMVLCWESRFWHKPIARGLFGGAIDTTFALYPPGAEFSRDGRSIRLGYPHLFEHVPWYVDDANPDPEERFFRDHASDAFTTWHAQDRQVVLEDTPLFQKYHSRKKILHLGCGNEYIPGWINIDVSGRKLDLPFDLNGCRTRQLPLENDSVDGFYMSHCFEHIGDTLALMEELYRVAKNGARIHLRLPYGSSDDALEDPTHVRPYFESSFAYFAQPAYSRADYGYGADWQPESFVLVVNQKLIDSGQENAFHVIRTQRNIVQEMIVELVAIKPARGRCFRDLRGGIIRLTSDPRIPPSFST
jgi:SAM-dependent methyltransferase